MCEHDPRGRQGASPGSGRRVARATSTGGHRVTRTRLPRAWHWTPREIETEREEAERKYNELWGSLTPDARALVAPDGPLSADATHSLAAVARRPLLRRLLFGPVQLIARLAGGGRARDEEPPPTPPETFALHFSWSNQEHMREQTSQADTESLISEP